MIKILIADDQFLFRSMLEEMLKRDSGIEIVASCSNGAEALDGCGRLKPDLVLLDIGMPVMGGIDVLRTLKEHQPEIKTVMLTTFEDDESIKTAVKLGADGYLIKDMAPETLIMSVKCIYNGMVLFHRGAYKLLRSSLSAAGVKNNRVEIGSMSFDAVDISIMQLIVKGKSNREIGAALSYSEGTVKNRISRLLSVTGFSDRTELSVFAINNGIV